MKQLETTEVVVSGTKFYIKPFPAFTAANISGELASVLTPFLGALAPLLDDKKDGDKEGADSEINETAEKEKSLSDIDAGEAAKAMSTVSISGDKLEKLMRKLLLGGHIAFEDEDEDGNTEPKKLNIDEANELFCGDVQDMFVLCFHVIRINFNGFFKKFAPQFGGVKEAVSKKIRKKV